jgi:hypothetical protein
MAEVVLFALDLPDTCNGMGGERQGTAGRSNRIELLAVFHGWEESLMSLMEALPFHASLAF